MPRTGSFPQEQRRNLAAAVLLLQEGISAGNRRYRGKIDALAGAVDFLQKNRADYVVVADGDIVANVPLDDVIDRHIKSGADLTMVCTKKQKNSPFTTYVELNRKKEAVDIRVGDCNEASASMRHSEFTS